MTIKVVEDDHGHATLMVHGEPDIITLVATTVTLLLASEADHIVLPDEGGADTEPEEDIAESA